MSDSKECKFKGSTFQVGDVVKLVNTASLYTFPNNEGEVRLEPNKAYIVVKVDEPRNFVEVMKENGEIEGCYGWRFAPTEHSITAESLRNSILSLQQERVSLQEQIEQNIAQEKSLTEQLKELGFLLVESKEQPTNVVDEKKTVLYAEDIEEDMGDSRNWKVGDYLECIGEGWTNFNNGNLYKITGFHCLGYPEICGENNTVAVFLIHDFKFHSRPVVN